MARSGIALPKLPKCTALSTYSYSLDEVHILKLQKAFIKNATKFGLYDGQLVNLDFHTVPHYGEESVLETHWAGARHQRMKGALTLFAQDSRSKLILYTDADIKRCESDDQVIEFLSFWKKIRRGVKPTLVFDSKFTSYAKLSELNAGYGVKFITLRRRGKGIIEVDGRAINVIYPRWAHNPILRQVPWDTLPVRLPWLNRAKLTLNFS